MTSSTTDEGYIKKGRLLITNGVDVMRKEHNAFWLVDCIASYQLLPKVSQEPFLTIDLTVNGEHEGTILVTDGNNNELHKQVIPYTDFPLDHIRFFQSDGVVMLPDEY